MNETVQKIADYVPMLKIGPYNGRSLQNMKHSDKLTMECENGKAQFINSESRSREVIEMALVTTGRQQLAGERETDHASDFTAHKARETEMSIVRRRRPYMFVLMLGQQISSILRHLFTSVSLHRLRSQIADPSDSFFLSAAQENSEMGAAYIPGAYSQYGRLRRVRIKRKMKTLTVVTSVIGCFAVCWIPFFVCFILEAYVGLLPHELTLFVTLLGYANSVCNPFIYALLDNRCENSDASSVRWWSTITRSTRFLTIFWGIDWEHFHSFFQSDMRYFCFVFVLMMMNVETYPQFLSVSELYVFLEPNPTFASQLIREVVGGNVMSVNSYTCVPGCVRVKCYKPGTQNNVFMQVFKSDKSCISEKNKRKRNEFVEIGAYGMRRLMRFRAVRFSPSCLNSNRIHGFPTALIDVTSLAVTI
ncbi:beta-3 adrenergic receptor [Clonorchis sinensis]|uniref:Beta-3 adrenergic receptor n=1 Tax=Clonorchis sinensis TaxID=79923 RepID=G7YBJ0_CLOSI|nr:beta-3 adrenergic receptor [Clonorchis sinensis]